MACWPLTAWALAQHGVLNRRQFPSAARLSALPDHASEAVVEVTRLSTTAMAMAVLASASRSVALVGAPVPGAGCSISPGPWRWLWLLMMPLCLLGPAAVGHGALHLPSPR